MLSETVRAEVIERLDLAPDRVRAVPNGVGREFAPPPEEARDAFLSRYRLSPGYLLYLGVLEPRKNLGLLVRSHRGADDHDRLFAAKHGIQVADRQSIR